MPYPLSVSDDIVHIRQELTGVQVGMSWEKHAQNDVPDGTIICAMGDTTLEEAYLRNIKENRVDFSQFQAYLRKDLHFKLND